MRISDWSSDVCSSDLWWLGSDKFPLRRVGQRDAESPARIVILVCRLRPDQMLRAGAVARFAGNVDLAPPRVVTVGLGIVILAQVRRMTARTAAVPVEVRASPVQRIAGLDRSTDERRGWIECVRTCRSRW